MLVPAWSRTTRRRRRHYYILKDYAFICVHARKGNNKKVRTPSNKFLARPKNHALAPIIRYNNNNMQFIYPVQFPVRPTSARSLVGNLHIADARARALALARTRVCVFARARTRFLFVRFVFVYVGAAEAVARPKNVVPGRESGQDHFRNMF